MSDKYGLDIQKIEASLEPGANIMGLVMTLMKKGVLDQEDLEYMEQQTRVAMQCFLDITLGFLAVGALKVEELSEEGSEEFAVHYGYESLKELKHRALEGINILPAKLFSSASRGDYDKFVSLLKE